MIDQLEESDILTCLVRFSWREREHPPSGRLHRLQIRTRRSLLWTWRHPTRRPSHRNLPLRTDTRGATFDHHRNSQDLPPVPQQPIRSRAFHCCIRLGHSLCWIRGQHFQISRCNSRTHAVKGGLQKDKNKHNLHDFQSHVQSKRSSQTNLG